MFADISHAEGRDGLLLVRHGRRGSTLTERRKTGGKTFSAVNAVGTASFIAPHSSPGFAGLWLSVTQATAGRGLKRKLGREETKCWRFPYERARPAITAWATQFWPATPKRKRDGEMKKAPRQTILACGLLSSSVRHNRGRQAIEISERDSRVAVSRCECHRSN